MAIRPYLPLLLLLFLGGCAFGDRDGSAADASPQAAVATAHPEATDAAMAILDDGGNAFDAAVSAAAVLGVTEPYSAGMGGGGFWLLQPAAGEPVMVDARETAPGAAHPDMYLDEDGQPLDGRPSLNGPLAAGIPGQPASFVHIVEGYGVLDLDTTLARAIELARDGIEVDERYHRLAGFRAEVMKEDPETRRIYLDGGDQAPEPGTLIVQSALADTLEALAQDGLYGFYRGPVAEALVADVQEAGGIWTLEDLERYHLIERQPVRIPFGEAEILTTPAPSSGGIALAQMFGMLAHQPAPASGVERTHHLVEVMRRAYHDRAYHLGDPAYHDIPRAQLLDPEYLATQADSIDPEQATASDSLTGLGSEGPHTTHLSVVDSDGNRVSATLTINYPFGAGVTSPQTGILLNNEMDDFSIKPGEPNAYGLIGGEANQVEAGKRPLSSMTPAILTTPERVTVLGTPGGSRIITMNFLGLLASLEGQSAEEVVALPRFHHQYRPDEIQHEPDTFSDADKATLESLGHRLKNVERTFGNMQVIHTDRATGRSEAASDPRGVGSARVREQD